MVTKRLKVLFCSTLRLFSISGASLPRMLMMLFLLCGLCAPSALARKSPVDYAELEKVMQGELKTTNTPGATIAIVSGDRIIYAKGFGVANVETGAPVSTDMLFRLGSTTKMFTSAALVTLAAQGKSRSSSRPTGAARRCH
jgi:CubicO group peptidase (beta-lactamase class C family)